MISFYTNLCLVNFKSNYSEFSWKGESEQQLPAYKRQLLKRHALKPFIYQNKCYLFIYININVSPYQWMNIPLLTTVLFCCSLRSKFLWVIPHETELEWVFRQWYWVSKAVGLRDEFRWIILKYKVLFYALVGNQISWQRVPFAMSDVKSPIHSKGSLRILFYSHRSGQWLHPHFLLPVL